MIKNSKRITKNKTLQSTLSWDVIVHPSVNKYTVNRNSIHGEVTTKNYYWRRIGLFKKNLEHLDKPDILWDQFLGELSPKLKLFGLQVLLADNVIRAGNDVLVIVEKFFFRILFSII